MTSTWCASTKSTGSGAQTERLYLRRVRRFGNVHPGNKNLCATCGSSLLEVPDFGSSRTRGHLRPRQAHQQDLLPPALQALAFDPTRPHRQLRHWVWQCWNCNHTQGNMNLRQWLAHMRALPKHLRLQVADRIDGVAELLVHLQKIGLLENDM